jgi:hypothetical protein
MLGTLQILLNFRYVLWTSSVLLCCLHCLTHTIYVAKYFGSGKCRSLYFDRFTCFQVCLMRKNVFMHAVCLSVCVDVAWMVCGFFKLDVLSKK